MKFLVVAAAFLAITATGTTARADADDLKWVTQCLKDNAEAKVGLEVVTKYCTCMNNKMDSNETQSITQWEKTHKVEMKACEVEAGWK